MRTPFRMLEEILHSLDRPDDPFNIHLELRVAGSLDERALQEATAAAVAVHPMARARKVSSRVLLRPAQWEIGGESLDGVVRSIECVDELALNAARADFYSRPIPVERTPALRLLIVHRPGGDSLLMAANHAVTDGIGTMRFLHSVARAYTCRADRAPAVDPLAARDLEAQFGRTLAHRPFDANPTARPTEPCSFVVPTLEDRKPGCGFVLVAVPAGPLSRNARSLVHRPTVNDLLLAALHQAIATWNADLGGPCRMLSILMPVNLRPAEWRNEIVANLTLGAPVRTSAAERSTTESLLAAVTAQTRRIKAGHDFVAFAAKPLLVRKLLLFVLLALGVRSRDTAVLSNLGRVEDVPDFGPAAGNVTELWFSPPVAMPTGLAVGAASLNGRLGLVIRYRRSLFDDRAASRFAQLLLKSLTKVAAREPEHTLPTIGTVVGGM